MKEERSGILDKEKRKYLRKLKNKENYNVNGEDENIYDIDISEQKRILEEFERKKRKENESIKNFYLGDEYNNSLKNKNNNFVLDDKTVNQNRLIICNIENIFDSENEDDDEYNINDFTWDNNTVKLNTFNNNENNIPNFTQNKIEINSNININQINNNINNLHNQNVINQFFDFTNNNMNNNNINFQYPNINNNITSKKYDDDFNPFLD